MVVVYSTWSYSTWWSYQHTHLSNVRTNTCLKKVFDNPEERIEKSERDVRLRSLVAFESLRSRQVGPHVGPSPLFTLGFPHPHAPTLGIAPLSSRWSFPYTHTHTHARTHAPHTHTPAAPHRPPSHHWSYPCTYTHTPHAHARAHTHAHTHTHINTQVHTDTRTGAGCTEWVSQRRVEKVR